jgi:hypothetical protein
MYFHTLVLQVSLEVSLKLNGLVTSEYEKYAMMIHFVPAELMHQVY